MITLTLLQAIAALTKIPAAALRTLFETAAAGAPDVAKSAEMLLAKLDQPLSPESFAALALILPPEALDILSGKFKGKIHPGDLAG